MAHSEVGRKGKRSSLQQVKPRHPLAFVSHLCQPMDIATASTLHVATPASLQSFTMRKSSWTKELMAPVIATRNPISLPITTSEQGRLFILQVKRNRLLAAA